MKKGPRTVCSRPHVAYGESMKGYVANIPDDLWNQFQNGEIHHLEYDDALHEATAVYSDGRSVRFSTAISPDMLERERRTREEETIKAGGKVFRTSMHVSIDFAGMRGVTWSSSS